MKYRRWLVLLLVSIPVGASYYVYDAISTLKELMQINLGFSSTEYGVVVSFYSFPNTFLLLAVIGGIIVDRFGIKKTGFLFVLSCTLGALLTAYGASDLYRQNGIGYGFMGSFLPEYSPELKMMILGRFLFGLGAETLLVVNNKVIAHWFKGSEIAFAFGLNLVVCRLGTAAALIFSPTFAGSPSGWTLALWVAAIVMFIGLGFFIVYSIADKREKIKTDGEEDRFHMSDIFELLKNRPFIYITLLCLTFYSAVFPFQAFAPDILMNKFGLDIELSGLLTSIIIWGTIIFTPIFGWGVDKYGKRTTLMIWGSAMLIIVHLILSLTSITPYIGMFTLGIAFSLVPAALWPSVPYIVNEKRLGTAYGLMASVQNLGLWGIPILAGIVTDYFNKGITTDMLRDGSGSLDYTFTLLMFAFIGIVALFFSFMLKRSDKKLLSGQLERGNI